MYAFGGDDPKKASPVFTSQEELDAANALAQGISKRRGLLPAHAGTKVGDVKPIWEIDPSLNNVKPKALPFSVPNYVNRSDIQTSNGTAWYNDPQTGDVVDIDMSVLNQPRFKLTAQQQQADLAARAGKPITKLAAGGTVGGSGLSRLANMLPGISDSIIDLIENNPNNYSKQPTYNATTMRNMVTPYSKMAYGGNTSKEVEVEGNEVIETPDGDLSKVAGPSHEEGGVDLSIPNGSNVYSDRIKIDGRTMAQRKVAREKTLARLQKLQDKNPLDKLLKATIERTIETKGFEENKDMEIQKVAAKIYAPPKQKMAMGGKVNNNNSYAYGDDGSSDDPYYDKLGWHLPGFTGIGNGEDLLNPQLPNLTTNNTNLGIGKKPSFATQPVTADDETTVNTIGNPTLGDYVGMAGNIFNAVAPLANTKANAAAMKPNINRFRGFGRDAIAANDVAQNVAAGLRSSVNTDIDTSSNSAKMRNRNSATSVNTIRALDAVTDTGTNDAKVGANNAFANQMLSLLGQRSQLENIQDEKVMTGETARDIEDKADVDNYYSNKAQNLVNFGTNIQGLGKNINQAKTNKVDAKLLSQLSQYGLEFDANGNLISLR